MKIFIKITLLIFISNSVFSNETEVIDLHETKILDQIVLDQLDNDDQLDNNIDLYLAFRKSGNSKTVQNFIETVRKISLDAKEQNQISLNK